MANLNTIIPEKIHLNKVQLIKDEIIILNKKLKSKPEYNVSVAHNTQHNLEKEIVKIRLFINLVGDLNKKKIPQGGNYEIDFYFKIEDINEQYETVGNSPIFSGVFVSILLGICYSTARGMLLEKWVDTILDGILLPVISIPKLLNSKKEI